MAGENVSLKHAEELKKGDEVVFFYPNGDPLRGPVTEIFGEYVRIGRILLGVTAFSVFLVIEFS